MAYIKNIIKVEVTEAENLKSMALLSRHSCYLPSDVGFRNIACKNPSSCEITDKVESKVRIFTSKLSFKTREQIDPGWKTLAYRVTTADGSRYLIGCELRPYPVLTRTENMPGSHTDSSLIVYVATWTGILKPLQII